MADINFIEKEQNDPPFLASFPSGIPTCVAEKNDFPFQFLNNKDNRKSKGSYIYGETDHLRFIGSTHESYNASKSNFNYAIGFFDPNKPSKVKLVRANGMYTVQQIHSHDVDGLDDDTIQPIDYQTIRTELTERFGSRKRKRELRSQASGKVDIEADESSLLALGAAVDKIADAPIDMEEQAKSDLSATHAKVLPKYNIDATRPEDIYLFQDILDTRYWSHLDLKQLTQSELSMDELKQKYPSFVGSKLHVLNNMIASNDARFKENINVFAAKLIYLSYLIRLYSRPPMANVVSMTLECSNAIGEHLSKTYYKTLDRKMSKESRVKLLCHICVVALQVCKQFTLDGDDIETLSHDTRTPIPQLLQLFRQVGCDAKPGRIRLMAPLRFPSLKRGRAEK